jgi:hypothetical protein
MRRALTRLRTGLSRFLRDRRGQVAFLTVVGMIPSTFLMFSIVNSGAAIQDATRSQDAADMIALVHAAEGARSMNTLAMNHVSLAQNYVTAVHASSMQQTLAIHQGVVTGAGLQAGLYIAQTCRPYASIPFIGAALAAACAAPAATYITELGAEFARAARIRAIYRPADLLRTANDALNALNDQNAEIINRFSHAVSQQAIILAQAHRISDFYYDEGCRGRAGSRCEPSNPWHGLDLPVTINQPMQAHLNFCMGLFYGTGGLGAGAASLLSGIPGIGGFSGIPLMNGSFARRGFPVNEGPMYGGAAGGDRYLPVHMSRTSGLGQALHDYQNMARERNLYNGLWNAHLAWSWPIRATEAVVRIASGSTRGRGRWVSLVNRLALGGTSTARYTGGQALDYFGRRQQPHDNIFTDLVQARVLTRCAGVTGGGAGALDQVIGALSQLGGLVGFQPVAQFDLYYPVQASGGLGGLPRVMPGLDDFPDAYRPLALTFRQGGTRWSPTRFPDPNTGFIRYAQALTYNPDETSMFSQNWRARLMPATRMHDRQAIINRMAARSPAAFNEFRADLQSVGGAAGWTDLVTR